MSRTFTDRTRRVSNDERAARGKRRVPSVEEVELFGLDDSDGPVDADAIREATSYLLDDVDNAEDIAAACARGRS